MKVFQPNENDCGNSLNIVDENNVFVGYDYNQQCCENFGYYFSKEFPNLIECESNDSPDEIVSYEFNHDDYVFDSSFLCNFYGSECPTCNMVIFRLVNRVSSEDGVYLVLYNYQNGYYYHGFELKIRDYVYRSGEI